MRDESKGRGLCRREEEGHGAAADLPRKGRRMGDERRRAKKKIPRENIEEKINKGYYSRFTHLIHLVKLFCQIIFPKQLSFIKKADHEAILQKNNFNDKAELCLTGP